MPIDLFQLKLEESPIPQAMDVYFDQVEALVRSGPRQRIALTNNIVDFPIRLKTRLFNNFVARSFADRAISRGSPVDTGEKFLGPANTNDRFSHQYGVLLNRALVDISLDLPQTGANLIEESNRNINAYETELNDLIATVLADWTEHKEKELKGLSEKEVQLRQVAWLDIHRLRRRIELATAKIDRELAKQESVIERVGSAEDSQIYRAYTKLRNAQFAYPKFPYLEEEQGLDELKMGNPLIVGTNPSWADVGAEVDAVADWEEFLTKNGERGFTIHRNDQSARTHERQWSVSARFRYAWYFSARLNASEHTKMQQSLADSFSIKFNFKRISEIWIRRGDWYDSSLFALPRVTKILSKDKTLAANLQYSVASLLVGRGFSMELEFNTASHYEYFRNSQMSGSAKLLNILPVGSGSVNETTTEMRHHDANKTITFADGDDVVRMIGFKVDQMHDLLTPENVLVRNGILETGTQKYSFLKANSNLPDEFFALAAEGGEDRLGRE